MLVVRVLVRHTDELESDLLMHFHGIDLHDLFTGRLSFRRLAVLINRLVGMFGKSAVSLAMLGEQARWGNTQYMIADLIDRVEISNWLTTEVYKAEGSSNPIPTPYPRPGMDSSESSQSGEGVVNELIGETETPRLASAQDIAEWFSQLGQ